MTSEQKQIFQKTSLLLEHYLDLKAYCDNATLSEHITDEEDGINADGTEITIKSISKNREVTWIIISHIDKALELLKNKYQAKGAEERYRALELLHLDQSMQIIPWSERISLISDELHCGETTVRRWRNEIVEELSIFLFGVDAL